MPTYYEIPLSPQGQTFGITLAGISYQFTLVWRDSLMGGWFLDIATSANLPLVSGIPLVTGLDLLEHYAYLGFPGQLIVSTDGDANAVPTFANLGLQSHLWFATLS